MNHRHLLPEEIDLLLDGELGFGVSPLKAHLRDCAHCRDRLEETQVVVDALEDLPHLAPSHAFAIKVMSQVPVFVPWHVAARDAVRQWLPQSRPTRVAVAGTATFVASLVTAVVVWATTQTDVLVFASGLAGDRLRQLVSRGGRDVIATVFGDQVFVATQQTGTLGLGLAFVGFIGAIVVALAGLRAIAVASSRRRD